MVRLGIYDNPININKNSPESKDSKQSFSFDFYTPTPVVSPFSLDAVNDAKPGVTGEVTGNRDTEDAKDTNGGQTGKKSEGETEDLAQIWWHFLGETSLHGCKNVKETQIIKRVVWVCFILAMASLLGWALLNLFLRYQGHPFVSVWGFQREMKAPPPGLTFCIPSNFNKQKLEFASPAYRLLVHAIDNGLSLFGGSGSNLKGYEENFDAWRQELDNISLDRSRVEIGFTKPELFWFSGLFLSYQRYDLTPVLEVVEGFGQSCWSVNWHKLDISSPGQDDHMESSEESFEEDNDNVNFTTYTHGYGNNSYNNISGTKNSNYNDGNDGVSLEDMDGFVNNSKTQSTTLASILSAHFLSSTMAPPKHSEFSHTSTPLFESSPDTEETGGENEGDHTTPHTSNEADPPVVEKSTGSIKLSPQDSVIFLVNIQQNNWQSDIHYAGLQVYLHDRAGSFWTEKPLLVRPGTLTNIYYKTTKYKFLPLPYKSFGGIENEGPDRASKNTGCVDTTLPSFKSRMASIPKDLYSSEMCMYEAAMNKTTIKCGCSSNSFYSELHGTPQCSIYDYITCFSAVMMYEYYHIQEINSEGKGEGSRCPQACKMVTYESIVTMAAYPTMQSREELMKVTGMTVEEIHDNVMLIDLKPQGPLTITVEHVPELTILNIVGSAGGWMGLCLGASLLTLTELFDVLVVSAWILCRKVTRRLRAGRF